MKEQIRRALRRLILWACPEVLAARAIEEEMAGDFSQGAKGAHAHHERRGLRVGGAHVWVVALLLIPAMARAQGGGQSSVLPLNGSGAPTGGCGNSQLYVDTVAGNLYDCKAGSWNLVTSGGSGTGFNGLQGTSFQDASEIATPANPSAGVDRLYLASSDHLLHCLTSSGGSCMPAGSGATFQTNSVNNTSQTTLNLLNSAATNGLTLTHTNTSAGNVQLGLSGVLTVPGGGSGLSNVTAGDLLCGNGTGNLQLIATGTAGQLLTSNGAGNCPSAQDPVISYNNPSETTAAWTSATANNTVLSVTLPAGTGVLSTVIVTLNQGSTITGGAVAFLASDTTGLTNTYPVYCIPQGAATGPLSSYTLTASTNIAFQCSLSSFEAFEVKLSPAITGTGTVNVGIQPTAAPSQAQVAVVNFPTTQPVSIAATVTVQGGKTNNNAAPGATNVGVLPCIANAAAPSNTEGDQTLCSQDLSGRERVVGISSDNGAAATTNRAPTLPSIYQTSYLNGTAATQGRDGALSQGTDGLLWTATLPSIRPASFMASSNFAGSSTTVVSRMPGNASNTVLVTKIFLSCTQTTAGILSLTLTKTSAAATGGTSANMTVVPMDSNYSAGVSQPVTYTGTGPTAGTAVGQIDAYKLGCLATGTASPNDVYIADFTKKPIVLRGTAQNLELNLGGAVTGGNLSVTWQWIETSTITP